MATAYETENLSAVCLFDLEIEMIFSILVDSLDVVDFLDLTDL